MALGKVKWFKDDLGYGFIEGEDGGPDVFVHFSVITPNEDGRKMLRTGQWVEYSAEQEDKGLRATYATPVAVAPS